MMHACVFGTGCCLYAADDVGAGLEDAGQPLQIQ